MSDEPKSLDELVDENKLAEKTIGHLLNDLKSGLMNPYQLMAKYDFYTLPKLKEYCVEQEMESAFWKYINLWLSGVVVKTFDKGGSPTMQNYFVDKITKDSRANAGQSVTIIDNLTPKTEIVYVSRETNEEDS